MYQYPTSYFLDRQRQPWSVCGGVVTDCLPCFTGRVCPEPMIECHAGAQVPLKHYIEESDHVIYHNRFLDSFGRGVCWKIISSGLSCFLMLSTVLILSLVKTLLSQRITDKDKTLMVVVESILSTLLVVVRMLQTLVLYWRERELRHQMEVTCWEDGTVTRGRPLSLFVLLWLYAATQCLVISSVIFGNLYFALHSRPEWTLFTCTLPVFLISEHFSHVLHSKLHLWHCVIQDDHAKLTLLETCKLLQEMWSKLPDFDTQNRVYAFKEAVWKSFHLETLRLSYMCEKWDAQDKLYMRSIE